MRKFLRSLAVITIVLGTMPGTSVAERVWTTDAPYSNVTTDKALSEAEWLISVNRGWEVFRAKGDSMHPVYGENSLLLISHTTFENLREGMIALYVDGDGDIVGHRLTQRDASGWRAKGTFSNRIDPNTIHPANYVGVVAAVMHTSGSSTPENLTVVTGKRY